MHLLIGDTPATSKTYRDVRNVRFAPAADIAGAALPVNSFSLDVITGDLIPTGVQADLLDDLGQLWARYWISDAQELDASTVHVIARSAGYILDRRKLPAVMYNAEPLWDILQDAMTGIPVWSVDPGLAAATISGFCPEQSARDRVLWAVFAAGGYCKEFFGSSFEILPIDTAETLVPLEHTFLHPAPRYADWVTSLRVRAYSYTSGEPAVTDDWVKAGNSVWIETYQDFVLQNPDAPADADPNEKEFVRCKLVNPGNVSAVLTHLSKYYFDRVTVQADVINNRAYAPGQRLSIYTREDQIVTGYCTRAEFAFGVQARSRLTLTAAQVRETAKLHFDYVSDGGRTLGSRDIWLPVGYPYEIQNPYFDQLWAGERIVYRPEIETATGTVPAGGASITVTYAPALILSGGVLQVISADSVSMEAGVVSV